MLAGGTKPEHLVQFYEDEPTLIEVVGRFTGAGIGAGDNVLVIARLSRIQRLRALLEERAIDLARAERSGRVVFVDAAKTLDLLLVRGMPDVTRFLALVEDVLGGFDRAHPGRWLRAYGEMVDVLCEQGNSAAALALEGLWNELARKRPFALLCGYAKGALAMRDADAICWAHTGVMEMDVRRRADTSA